MREKSRFGELRLGDSTGLVREKSRFGELRLGDSTGLVRKLRFGERKIPFAEISVWC